MPQRLLSVEHLSVSFQLEGNTIDAVKDISYPLYPGETLGIVGESGSGKSVSSLAIMGLVPQPPGKIENGKIIFNPSIPVPINLLSLDYETMNAYRGKDIAMIFQEPMTSLNPVFNCGDQVQEAIELHLKLDKKQARNRVLELFEKVKLPQPSRIYHSYPHELSGGQKQRVMIAMALSCNPKILIADEPTTALDVTVQKAILDLIAELQQEIQASVIFISHDLSVIAEIADRVLVMYKGRIVEQGKVADIFINPQHPYTKGLLACRPPLNFRLERLPVIADFMKLPEEEEKQLLSKNQNVPAEEESFIVIRPEERALRLEKLYAQAAILEVKNLRTWFPTKKNFFGKVVEYVKAVDDVSFNVYPGETLGLVGESGCGKTTLGRTIIGLHPPKSGSIFYKGKDLLQMSPDELKKMRQSIQLIFQDPYGSLNPRMTIGQTILEPVKVHQLVEGKKNQMDYIKDLMETVGLLPDWFDRYPHEFSGGQRQRVGIARALAVQPEFLICDESVSALDVSVQAQVLNLLKELQEKKQLTYIFISHDLSVVKFMSDRMMVMNQGKIVEIGEADHLYQYPSSDYTKKLIDAIPKGL